MINRHLMTIDVITGIRSSWICQAIGLGLWLNLSGVYAQPVHVQVDRSGATEYGAGNSVGKGSECFVITPFHVIEDAGKNAITVTDVKGKRAKASVVKYIQDFDAALLKLKGNEPFDCPEDWDDGADLKSQIEGAPFLIAKKINSNGRIEQNRLFVSGLTAETIDLEPYNEKNKLQEGDSGSSLYAGSRLVGMVVSVDTANGAVTAVSQSQIHGLFGNDVLTHDRQTAMLVPFVYNRAENVYATSAAHDYLDQRTPFVLRESGPLTRQQLASGEIPPAPDGIDYMVSGKIVEISSKRISNPNYQPEDKNKKQSFKDRFLTSLKKSLTKVDKTAPYLMTYNIDIEIQVLETASNKRTRNLERSAYQIPDDGANKKELEKTVIQKAIAESLEKTFRKYGLPTS